MGRYSQARKRGSDRLYNHLQPPSAPGVSGTYFGGNLTAVTVTTQQAGDTGGTMQLWGDIAGKLGPAIPNNTAGPQWPTASVWNGQNVVWVTEIGNGINYGGSSGPSNQLLVSTA